MIPLNNHKNIKVYIVGIKLGYRTIYKLIYNVYSNITSIKYSVESINLNVH